MSKRTLKITRNTRQKYADIEDVDDILNEQLNEQADKLVIDQSLDVVPEETPEEVAEDRPVPIYDARKSVTKSKKTMSVKINAKGRRVVQINELDPNLIPPTMEEFMNPKHTGSKIAVIGKPGCFAKGTMVRMYDGSTKRVEDVRPGDLVMGDDFKERKVGELCRERELMYQVEIPKEKTVDVNANHILSLLNSQTQRVEDMTVNQFIEMGLPSHYRWMRYLPDGSFSYSNFGLRELDESDYYGFTLGDNHRFLLDDYSVVHNTGKSTIIKSILYEKSEIFPCAQVFSGTEDSNHAYASFMPSSFIFNGFSQSVYVDFIKRQKLAKAYLDNPWAVEIWDDITEDERIFNLPVVKGTYKNGRHWKMLHILSLQYALDIKPVIRTNIDGTFILRETIKRNRKVLFENYSSVFDDYNDFSDVMDTVTNDFTALYIHNRTQSNSFEDCVFWYRAREDIPEDFMFGCQESWMFHNERYNPAYVDPIEV